MANVSELVILLRAVNMASRELNNLDRQVARAQTTAARASSAMVTAEIQIQNARKNTTAVTAAETAKIESVLDRAAKSRDNALKQEQNTLSKLENARGALRVAEAKHAATKATVDAQSAKGAATLVASEEAVARSMRGLVKAREDWDRASIHSAQLAASNERQIEATVSSASRNIIRAKEDQTRIEQKAGDAAAAASQKVTAMSNLARTGILAAGAAAIGTVAIIGKLGFAYNSMKQTAVTAFTGILKDAPKAAQFTEELYEWTRKTSLGFDLATRSAQEFLARGFAVETVIPTLESIANAAAALPRPMEESMQRISYAIGQISQSAKLHSQDIRQLTEAGINAWGYLQEATGASIDEMQSDALEFGLTGKRVADIILKGIARDFPNQLQLQRATMRGATAEFSRNAQEIAGIFSKPFFDKFLEGLHAVNKALNDPGTRAAAERYGQTFAAIFIAPISAAEYLVNLLKEIDSRIKSLPSIPGLPGSPGGGPLGLPNVNYEGMIPGIPQISKTIDEINKISNSITGSLETQLGRLGVEMQRLTEQRDAIGAPDNLREQLQVNRLNEDISATQSKIDSLQREIAELGGSANQAGAGVISLSDKIKAAEAELSAFEPRAASTRESLAKAFSEPIREVLEAQYEALRYQVSMADEVNRLESGLSDLDREARNAAKANALQVRALDDNIRAIERSTAARDRAEQRADMVESMVVSGTQKALNALDQQERALQRKQMQADARTGTPDERAAAQLALRRFDLEDKLRREEEAAELKRQKLELERFDRATREMEQMQALQDQRDALIRRGEEEQAAYNAQKEDIQAQLDFISQGVKEREAEVTKLQQTNELLQKEIELQDPFLKTQGELKTQAEKLKEEFQALIQPVADLKQLLFDLHTEQAQLRQIELQNIAAGELQQYGGARASGGRVYPNKWYMVGEHGPEPFIPDSAGTVIPNNATTNNNRKVTVLAPITIYNNNNSNNEDALDFLFKKM